MRGWFKENWFKVSILIALLIAVMSVAYYFVIFLPAQQNLSGQQIEQANNSFSYQERCASAANNFYTKNGFDENNSVHNGYISHWNKSLDKCFIELSNGLGDSIIYELADAVEGTEYGEIQWTIPNEDKPGWCMLYPSGSGVESSSKSCNSKTEFDNFVKTYME